MADVDGLVDALQQPLALQRVDGGLVGDALKTGLGVVHGLRKVDLGSGVIGPSQDRRNQGRYQQGRPPPSQELLKKNEKFFGFSS